MYLPYRTKYEETEPCPGIGLPPHLRDWVREHLASELQSATKAKALVVPLGGVANEPISYLEAQGLVELGARCLRNFPHPSGANGHRAVHFARGLAAWQRQLLT